MAGVGCLGCVLAQRMSVLHRLAKHATPYLNWIKIQLRLKFNAEHTLHFFSFRVQLLKLSVFGMRYNSNHTQNRTILIIGFNTPSWIHLERCFKLTPKPVTCERGTMYFQACYSMGLAVVPPPTNCMLKKSEKWHVWDPFLTSVVLLSNLLMGCVNHCHSTASRHSFCFVYMKEWGLVVTQKKNPY